MPDFIQVKQEDRVLHIILNRPEKRNALNIDFCQQLVQTLDHADSDRSVGAVLVTANGPTFCAGMDLLEAQSVAAGEINRVQEQLFCVGSRIGTPIVAAVHGGAIAGGTGLVANCHIAIASEDATFGLTEVRIGLWPFLIYRTVVAAVGERRAIELALTGRIFSALEGKEYGLVQEVVPRSELIGRATTVAKQLSEASPSAVRSGLMFVQELRGKDSRQANDLARDLRTQIWKSADFREGLAAFRDKREPRWPSVRQ